MEEYRLMSSRSGRVYRIVRDDASYLIELEVPCASDLCSAGRDMTSAFTPEELESYCYRIAE